jgi:hypothetical protein
MGTESYISCMSLSKKPAKFYWIWGRDNFLFKQFLYDTEWTRLLHCSCTAGVSKIAMYFSKSVGGTSKFISWEDVRSFTRSSIKELSKYELDLVRVQEGSGTKPTAGCKNLLYEVRCPSNNTHYVSVQFVCSPWSQS